MKREKKKKIKEFFFFSFASCTQELFINSHFIRLSNGSDIAQNNKKIFFFKNISFEILLFFINRSESYICFTKCDRWLYISIPNATVEQRILLILWKIHETRNHFTDLNSNLLKHYSVYRIRERNERKKKT